MRMARKTSTTLTDAELPLMQVLWERGRATVGDVAEALPKNHAVAYNTVLTTLRILERKGYVRHTKDGRAFVYQAVVDRGQASGSALRQVLNRFFDNSPEALVQRLIEDESLAPEELERLTHRIENE
jgi:predicted transcriptional regulator